MKYRMGIDMGTNSIGWCLWTLEEEEGTLVPKSILDIGVRVFSDGRDPKGEPLAVQRRTARSMRRRRDRMLERKRKLIRTLVDAGYLSPDVKIRRQLAILNPYKLRTKALSEKLSKDELARVLLHLGGRRGFKSNRKAETKDEKETTGLKLGIKTLWQRIREGGFHTLGEYLYKRINGTQRFKQANEEAFPDRSMYEKEFEEIRKFQEGSHADLPWDTVQRTIYFQRPLKPVERGRCTFYLEEFRAWKALPSAQRFRYLQTLLNLKKIDRLNQELPLTPTEINKAIELFESSGEVTIAKLKKHLRLESTITFNFENQRDPSTGKTTEVKFKGNETLWRLRNAKEFSGWFNKQPEEIQDQVIEQLITFQHDEETEEYLRALPIELSHQEIETVLNIRFPIGTMSVSAKFMRECNTLMRTEYLAYHEAAKRIAGHHSDMRPKEQRRRLPYYGEVLRDSVVGAKPQDDKAETNPEIRYGKIMNPTVHVALNQLRKLVNTIVDRHGKPEELVIELSRELPMSATKKRMLIKEQNSNRVENEKIRKRLNDMRKDSEGTFYSIADVQKYKLWVELNNNDCVDRSCVYCGAKISATEFLLDSATEVEHILPYSRTLMDGLHNKTIAHSKCNRDKGNRSPFEAFGHSPAGYNWDDILMRASRLPVCKRRKFNENAMEDFDKNSGFIQRQLTDNQYISRIARRYLSFLIPDEKIWTANGRLTADLRHAWGLNSILSKKGAKERADHRHHALDAMVVALIDRRTVQLAASANKFKGKSGFQAPTIFPVPRKELIQRFKSIYTSHKPDHGVGGALFLETAYGQVSIVEQVPVAEVRKKKFDSSSIISPKIRAWVEDGAQDPIPDNSETVSIFRQDWASRSEVSSLLSGVEIGRIVDPKIREALYTSTAGLTEKSPEWKQALEEFSKRSKIKRVRTFPKNKTFELLPKHGQNKLYKGYQTAPYLCVDIWHVPTHTDKEGRKKSASFQGMFISRLEALNAQAKAQLRSGRAISAKPHPAAKFVCQLFKHDVLMLQSALPEGVPRLARVAGFAATTNKLDVQPLNSTNDIASWLEFTNEEVLESGWNSNSKKKRVSINVLFGSDNRAHKVHISIDSKLVAR